MPEDHYIYRRNRPVRNWGEVLKCLPTEAQLEVSDNADILRDVVKKQSSTVFSETAAEEAVVALILFLKRHLK